MSELDGGGWTLVWQHSNMEDLPLNLSMRYFSKDYTPCVTRASGWCNIPNKARLIVAYHELQCMHTRVCLIGTLTVTRLDL